MNNNTFVKLFIRSCFDREAIPLPFNQEALIDIESELTNYPRLTLSSFTNKQNLVSRKDGAGKIKLRAAPKGTGIIAGGPVRAVCEVLGIKDIVAKSIGTANPHNVIRACMKALSKQYSPKTISILRNKKISEIIEKRG